MVCSLRLSQASATADLHTTSGDLLYRDLRYATIALGLIGNKRAGHTIPMFVLR